MALTMPLRSEPGGASGAGEIVQAAIKRPAIRSAAVMVPYLTRQHLPC